ncbi:hypothetical protein M2459_000479 [Parabacteroides sp. PF5-5]|uniref:hypothetical protein n=1 Tax=unclassified Parabacteroides TaxID=2649774 RepID=UPI00247403B4|nr:MULTISPECIES: hypothetical protein [unclassified Parabacteroides]MDH6303587.1 hypothetical protein [Parabacteroides sp. PH5-39]MDH6314909.1 hypothetical protein [Parabacteroides sp. PF5-13]MDH6318246.1 hypothetical protein [Parabacteroides sp. PH5-13]MDH6321821.1 hypothetical protein [Parabacteroides sp. PH5-8]MDH6325945.1 hypothetical protein [Parabacteroides sp. PH5-41]
MTKILYPMKYVLTFLLLLGASCTLFSQEYSLSSLQGLRNAEGEISLECSGYDILISRIKGTISNTKTMEHIRKDYSLRNIQAEYTDSSFIPLHHKIIESVHVNPGRESLNLNQVAVLLQQKEKEVTILYFETMNQRDIVLEREIVKAWLSNGLAPYISDSWKTTVIPFVGKEIDLVYAFDWSAPHFISGGGSQMKWSEFPSMMAAELDINKRIDFDMSGNVEVLHEGDIQVLFDSIPTLAYRVVYKSYHTDAYSDVLTTYYIAEEVRGKYISCILTHYGRNVNDYQLSYLLQKVMTLSEMPPQIQLEESEYVYESEYEKDKSKMNMIELQVGTWLPVGKLSRVFTAAPSIGAYVGYPFSNTFKIDMGVQLAFPVNRSHFTYYDHNTPLDAKANVVVGLNLRGHYQQQVGADTFFTLYAGLGINGITTNLERVDYSEDTTEFYSCETVDVFGGASIRYRLIGLFAEYHYVPYSISGKVKDAFGNSAFNLGLMFSF